MDIYDAIVNGLKSNMPINTRLENYLQSLQNSVKALRIAYRNNPVYVPYEKIDIQAAYLTTYLPHYYQLIYKIFIEEVPEIFKGKRSIHLTFIGGGPGSEAYGAVKYILNNCKDVEKIHITILDINASTWSYSHQIVLKNLIEVININNKEINWEAINFDLISDIAIKNVKTIIEKSDLLVIQNCLNEIATINLPSLKNNIKSLFEYLPGDGFLLLSDMTSVARPTMKFIEKYLLESFAPKFFKTTLSTPSSRCLISVHHRPSILITQNLLNGTNGLIPRKNISYDYSIISKGIIEKTIEQTNLGFNSIYRPLDFKNLDANDYIHTKIFIGIDFGTSSTVISTAQLVNDKIKIKSIPIKQKDHLGTVTKNPLVPTVISFVNGNRLLVGSSAEDHKPYLSYGLNTWHSFKQNLRTLEEVKYPNSLLSNNPSFRISNGKEALTLFLSYLKREIFEYLNENELPNLVEYAISVPASFSSKEKTNLKECLINAGIDCEDTPFIEEPNAALINYLFEQNIYTEKNVPKNILVLDLGAGTVDVSILKAINSNDGFTSQLLSVMRLGNIGGNLLNKLIADSIFKNSNINSSIEEKYYLELINLSEKLKIKLCKDIITDATINYELPPLGISNEKRTISSTDNLKTMGLNSIELTFNEFNSINNEYWEGTFSTDGIKKTIDNAILNANITASNIDKVILTGGGGRNPYIKNLVFKYFKDSEIFISDNIQEQVSRGAALHSFVVNAFGKNIITPILGHDINLNGQNKSVLLFENGTNIPSTEIEIEIEEFLSLNDSIIQCFSKENTDYQKKFIIPANISAKKLVFYLAHDYELKCEIIDSNYEKEAVETFENSTFNLIKIK
jgi:molecular chaperone DnaK (HSP70)